jgi:hypothetical protein
MVAKSGEEKLMTVASASGSIDRARKVQNMTLSPSALRVAWAPGRFVRTAAKPPPTITHKMIVGSEKRLR